MFEGALVYVSEEGPEHAVAVRWLLRVLIETIPAGEGGVGAGDPLAATELSEPEPDRPYSHRPWISQPSSVNSVFGY